MNFLEHITEGAPAAGVILALMLGASVATLYWRPQWLTLCLLRPYWLLRRQQWSTVVTSGFVHADLGHLLFNAFTFWAFAFSLERSMGSVRFVGLYCFGLLASAAGTWWMHRREPQYASLGASGAILAVLFAAIVYTPSQSLFIMPIPVPIPAPLFALGYLGYTMWAARRVQSGGINHDAHLWGALAGVLFVALSDPAALSRALRYILG